MTVEELYTRLYSKTYYDVTEQNKFRFSNNALIIDRCAFISFVIHMLDGIFYLQVFKNIRSESLFRIEIHEADIGIYSITNDHRIWTLE